MHEATPPLLCDAFLLLSSALPQKQPSQPCLTAYTWYAAVVVVVVVVAVVVVVVVSMYYVAIYQSTSLTCAEQVAEIYSHEGDFDRFVPPFA